MTLPLPRNYDPEVLVEINPQDLTWSRTFARTLLRDRPEVDKGGVPVTAGQPTRPREPTWPTFSRTDVEINTALALDAVKDETGVLYYRPHVTAARLYLGDPALWRARSVDGTSESRRDPKEITAAWLAQGKAIDALIPVDLIPAADVPITTKRVVRTAGVVVRPEEQGC